ncbi:MAG TPA: hypothetical protein VMU61_03260 [Candidatus Aquilonibacter sp.]|nr:hypothetical protein [Candidatus Aquilonibacter sp.]
MPEPDLNPTPVSQTAPVSPAAPAKPPAQSGPTIRIGEEFGTAKKNLPPAKIVAITIAAVVVIVAFYAFFDRAKPQGGGSLDSVVAVQIPGQNAVLAALTLTLRNGAGKPLWVHDIKARMKTGTGELTADAVSAVDFERYFEAFPALKANAQPALSPEDKLQPGQQVQRSIMVSFPVTLDQFNQRQSLSVAIQPYDQPVPIVLSK